MSRLVANFLLTGLIALTTVGAASAEGLINVRWQTNYTIAHKLRISARMPMLVFVTTDDCHFCHKMLATTYSDQDIARRVANQFVATKVNANEQAELVKRFGVRVFPTTFLIGPDNRVLDRIEGYVTPDEFRERIARKTVAAKIQRYSKQ